MSRLFDSLARVSATRQSPVLKPDELLQEVQENEGAVDRPTLIPGLPELVAPVSHAETPRARGAVDPPPIPVPTPDEPARLVDLPVAGEIPISPLNPNLRLLTHAKHPVILERYRRLRTKLLQQREAKGFRSLVVTSAVPQEGKTLTSVNLALSFAMIPDFKVLVIDADTRKGSLDEWVGLKPGMPGLTNLIDGSAQLKDVLLVSRELPLYVIPRGNSEIPPAELLHSSELKKQFGTISNHFDLIIVDSPPVTLISDVQLIAAASDAVLLVARAYFSTQKLLQKAVQDLQGFRMVGVVLNAGESPNASSKYSKYQYGTVWRERDHSAPALK